MFDRSFSSISIYFFDLYNLIMYQMAHKVLPLYCEKHCIPVYDRNGHCEDRNLSININDDGDKLQIKLRDLSDYLFNYTECLDLGDFEVIRVNQNLDINYAEFKANIVEMLQQFQNREMLIKCQLSEQKCTLVFFTKSKIKSMVYLTLDLRMTRQNDIIAEMHAEIQGLEEINKRLQKLLTHAKNSVKEKQEEIQELEVEIQRVFERFFLNLKQIHSSFCSKLNNVENEVLRKIQIWECRLSGLQQNVDILKKENNLKADSSDRLIKTMESLRFENAERDQTIENLKKENTRLNILRVTLERNIADLKKSLQDIQNERRILEQKKAELEKDLEKLSIAVTQKDSKLNELSKDLVQANNMLVQFNNRYDNKVQEVEGLQEQLAAQERILTEKNCQTNQILRSFEQYKSKFNAEEFVRLEQDLLLSNKRIHELEEETRKLNKMNALLSQKVGQGGFFNPKFQ